MRGFLVCLPLLLAPMACSTGEESYQITLPAESGSESAWKVHYYATDRYNATYGWEIADGIVCLHDADTGDYHGTFTGNRSHNSNAYLKVRTVRMHGSSMEIEFERSR